MKNDRDPTFHTLDNGAGWHLSLKKTPPARQASARPVLIVPGYGMNSFIFGFHPCGLSLEGYLASRGLEVWSVDLRGQGRAVRTWGDDRFGLAELGVDDVGASIRRVLELTATGRDRVDLIGCSLGTTLVFAHLACAKGAKVHSVVNFGGLVRWVKIHPAVRAAFFSPWLIGQLRLRGTRQLARAALPVLARYAPRVLSVYMNVASTDTTHAETMVQTVEDPSPIINREIATWIATRDLVVRGVNVSDALRAMTYPHLSVIANNDGIVPPETARFPYDAIGSADKELFAIGDATRPIAHADLFLSNGAQDRIFERVAAFLLRRNEG